MNLAAYIPFLYPLPGSWNYWYLWLLPLCVAVSIVYKSIKCATMEEVPRQAAVATMWILLAMAAAAIILTIIVKIAV